MTKQAENALKFWASVGIFTGGAYIVSKLFTKKDSIESLKERQRVRVSKFQGKNYDTQSSVNFYVDSNHAKSSHTNFNSHDISGHLASNDEKIAYKILKNKEFSKHIISLLFDGISLRLIINDNGSVTRYTFQAVSGAAQSLNGKNYFTYQKDRQYLKNSGPIPEGEYFITPLSENEDECIQYWDDMDVSQRLLSVVERGKWKNGIPAWGRVRIPIQPKTIELVKNGEIITRGNFFIHGGIMAGSAGCIDLWRGNEKFFEIFLNCIDKYKTEILSSGGKIPLIVKYEYNTKMECDNTFFTKHCKPIK